MEAFEKFTSREKNFILDKSEMEMFVYSTASDPVSYMETLRDEVLEEHGELTSVALVAADHMEAVYDALHMEGMGGGNDLIQAFIHSEKGSQEYHHILVQLFHAAGYSKAEVLTWAKNFSEPGSPTAELVERGKVAIVEEVYGREQ